MLNQISGADRTAAKQAFTTLTKRINKMRDVNDTAQDLDDRKTFVQVDNFTSRGVSPTTGSAQFKRNGEVKSLELTQQNPDGWAGPFQNYVRDTITVLFEPGHNPFRDGFDRLQDVKIEHEDSKTRAADAAEREKQWTIEAEARGERLRDSGYRPVYWVENWLGGWR